MVRPVCTLPIDFPEPLFRPVDGHVEVRVAEAAEASLPRPRRVTAIIAAMCERLGSYPADEEQARRVSAAGREWLLQQSGLQFFRGSSWFEAPCSACAARFDLELPLGSVPRGLAGKGFPEVEVRTSLGPRRFEAPNGHHEEAMVARSDGDPRRIFASLCSLADQPAVDAARFLDEDLDRIDAALETMSPDVADGVDVTCPDCGQQTRVRIDPLTFAFPRSAAVLQEVHVIAQAYRWAEADILALPSRRRRTYVALIRGDTARPANRTVLQ
jgi:hypothetical protein